jgi:transposase
VANKLKMAEVEAILRLWKQGWSQRRIAQDLGVDRETVARYLRGATDPPKPANAPPGSEAPKPAIAPPGSAGRRSDCEPLRQTILEALKLGLSARRIYQDLVAERGFTGSYYSVRRFVRRLAPDRALPTRRLESAPGQEAQVDFGKGAPVVLPDGRRRRTWVFRIVLSHSRKAFSESVYRQTTDEFIRCLEDAFWHFGGVPRTLVIDNLKAAVSQADWYDPELNPKLRSFCEHYNTVVLPTKPYTPRHKGKVEREIGYVSDNGLKGRQFGGLEQQNCHLLEWETHIADTRIHGTTKKQVGKLFTEVEQKALQPLPLERFAFFHEAQRKVHRDAHVEVDKAYYSVPPEYVGWELWVRWDSRVVRIFDRQMKPIAIHVKHEAGHFSTQPEHISSKKISGVERGAEWLLSKVSRVGPHTVRWAEAMLRQRGIEGVRALVGLLSLTKKHRTEELERACEAALTHGALRLRILRQLLKRQVPKQELLEFIQEHPIIRDLSVYEELVCVSFTKEPVVCSYEMP